MHNMSRGIVFCTVAGKCLGIFELICQKFTSLSFSIRKFNLKSLVTPFSENLLPNFGFPITNLFQIPLFQIFKIWIPSHLLKRDKHYDDCIFKSKVGGGNEKEQVHKTVLTLSESLSTSQWISLYTLNSTSGAKKHKLSHLGTIPNVMISSHKLYLSI